MHVIFLVQLEMWMANLNVLAISTRYWLLLDLPDWIDRL